MAEFHFFPHESRCLLTSFDYCVRPQQRVQKAQLTDPKKKATAAHDLTRFTCLLRLNHVETLWSWIWLLCEEAPSLRGQCVSLLFSLCQSRPKTLRTLTARGQWLPISLACQHIMFRMKISRQCSQAAERKHHVHQFILIKFMHIFIFNASLSLTLKELHHSLPGLLLSAVAPL